LKQNILNYASNNTSIVSNALMFRVVVKSIGSMGSNLPFWNSINIVVHSVRKLFVVDYIYLE